jgi:ATP-dependent protease ClpP protease subunit
MAANFGVSRVTGRTFEGMIIANSQRDFDQCLLKSAPEPFRPGAEFTRTLSDFVHQVPDQLATPAYGLLHDIGERFPALSTALVTPPALSVANSEWSCGRSAIITNHVLKSARIKITGSLREDAPIDDYLKAIAAADKVEVVLKCDGGCACFAMALHAALRKKDSVAIIHRGLSAGLIIAQAARFRKMFADGQLMMHRAGVKVVVTRGCDIPKAAETVDQYNKTLAAFLELRVDPAIVAKWFECDSEHWYTAEQALAMGLVDEIIPAPATRQPSTDPDADVELLTAELLGRLRPLFKNEENFLTILQRHAPARVARPRRRARGCKARQ